MINTGPAESLYLKLSGSRSSYLDRARDSAKLTIPTIMPDEGHTAQSKFDTPYQSVGARGVNNLSSALLLSLLPPNAPFFRLVVDQAALNEIQQGAGGEALKTQIESSLAQIERTVMSEIETQALRVHVYEAVRHLIVCGNVLLHLPETGGMRVLHLDRYVVKRGPMGEVLKIIVKESIAQELLPTALKNTERLFQGQKVQFPRAKTHTWLCE